MDEEMDIVVFEDEDGNEVEFELLFSFEHQGKEYGVLQPVQEEEAEDDQAEAYILEIAKDENGEEVFTAVPDELLEELTQAVETLLEQELEEGLEEE